MIVKLPNGVEFDGTYNEFTTLYERGVFGQIVYVQQQQEEQVVPKENGDKQIKEKKHNKKHAKQLSKDDIRFIMKNLEQPIKSIAKKIGKTPSSINKFLSKNHGGLRNLRKKLNIVGVYKHNKNVDYSKNITRLHWVNERVKGYMLQGVKRIDALKLAHKDYAAKNAVNNQ